MGVILKERGAVAIKSALPKFVDFKAVVKHQFDSLSSRALFVTEIRKDVLWDAYLSSFPAGSNPLFRERTEHDCQCCKSFIRACGNVVAIADNSLVSIWDVEIGGAYQMVADALSKLVKSRPICAAFLHTEKTLGTDFNHEMLEAGDVLKWNHFHYMLPGKFVKSRDGIGTTLSHSNSNKDVFKRSLQEISTEAIETTLELIEQKSIYRGGEHKSIIKLFLAHKRMFDSLDKEAEKDNYAWAVSMEIGGAAKARNTVIGTLMIDISEGKELDIAVKAFESKVAPTNYKRPSALITKKMIMNAEKKVTVLGIASALSRRHATIEDITINNIIFADRTTKKEMNVFDEMQKEVPVKIKNLKRVEEVDINTFIANVLPRADGVEVFFDNKHTNNLMSLLASPNPKAKHIFKWGNSFSWAYNGEVADSLKLRVKKAGGNVEGDLRFSIQWNDGDNNQNDFDAHCVEPDGNLISYPKKGWRQPSTGMLDVDIITPGKAVAVENITWTDKARMQEGKYTFLVHNYSHYGGKTGFTAEIEYDGNIYTYCYDKELRNNEKVVVAVINFTRENGVKFVKSLPSTQATKEIWNLHTNQFHKVRMVMASPNHWDGQKTGNKHWFFIIENCKNPEKARGFFNEFLSEGLSPHRKVFEVLGSKMKADFCDNQLSGLGFSSTRKNSFLCKVTGSFSRLIKVNV